MAMREMTVHKNHTLFIYFSYLSLTIFFIMIACPDHILESTKGSELNKMYTWQ